MVILSDCAPVLSNNSLSVIYLLCKLETMDYLMQLLIVQRNYTYFKDYDLFVVLLRTVPRVLTLQLNITTDNIKIYIYL